ncbi:MAG: hypothetical protein H7Z16_00040 [Pyrinomonadaceae bacterium]|nr:hypothetical protein [Pyrinomonadaceae bacterium]
MTTDKGSQTLLLFLLAITLALVIASCAPLQPTSPTGPRGSEPPYPVLLAEDSARRETAQGALNRLRQSTAPARSLESIEPNLSPITATIQSLPANGGGGVYLPKVGADAVMNEEETRESLRRFIRDWREIIGSEPARLSLVDHLVQPDGTSVANYEQRPFRFPIRGNYGKLQIRFAADRRILSISSTCLPDADKLRSALRGLGAGGGVSARLTAEDATKKLRENDLPSSDPAAGKPTFRLPASTQLTPRELVTHVQPSKTRADALEFRLAWEIELSNAPFRLAYLDAITGEVIEVK